MTLWILAFSVIALLVVGLFLDRQLGVMLRSEFDRNLMIRADALTLLSEIDEGIVEFEFDEPDAQAMTEFHGDTEFFAVYSMNGEPLYQSSTIQKLDSDERVAPLLSIAGEASEQAVFSKGEIGGVTLRMVQTVFKPRVDSNENEQAQTDDAGVQAANEDDITRHAESTGESVALRLVVARQTDRLLALRSRVRMLIVMAFLGLLASLAFATRIALRKGLAPVDILAAEVGALDEEHLHLRVSEPVGARELNPVVQQLNNTLDRIESAFARERSFSGNVAHELRTPIAELRSFAEVGAKWPDDQAMVVKFFGELITLADDMERTVVNLLMLARLESGQDAASLGSLGLADAVARAWKRLAVKAGEKNIRFESTVPESVTVQSDGDKLGLILSNLLSNAVAHGSEGGVVRLDAQTTNGIVELTVSNDVNNIDETDLPRMFDRFWRKDAARTPGRHVGLGLSIVKALSDVLGLEVSPQLANRRFEVVLDGFKRTDDGAAV